MPERYRKKPVVIEAIQYTSENVQALCEWLPFQLIMSENDGLVIPTMEGEMTGSVGDWIIKGIQGEFYPCKPDIFQATYELVGDN